MSEGDPTIWGHHILEHIPDNHPGISDHTLIMERLRGSADYAGYQQGITELITAGYLKRTRDGLIKRTKKRVPPMTIITQPFPQALARLMGEHPKTGREHQS